MSSMNAEDQALMAKLKLKYSKDVSLFQSCLSMTSSRTQMNILILILYNRERFRINKAAQIRSRDTPLSPPRPRRPPAPMRRAVREAGKQATSRQQFALHATAAV